MPYRQLVDFVGGHFVLNEETVSATIGHPKYVDRKVCLVGTVGKVGSGKSFLSTFLSQYALNAPVTRLEGSFRAGDAPATKGVQILEPPLHHMTKSGDQVVVFLLDTQAVDTESETWISDWIMTFTLLISEVLIFNVISTLPTAEELRQISRALEASARFVQGAPIDNLLFVVRDVESPHLAAAPFLESIWEACKEESEMAEVSNLIRDRIANIDCAFTSTPSELVKNASLRICFKDPIDQKFLDDLIAVRKLVQCYAKASAPLKLDLDFWKRLLEGLEPTLLAPKSQAYLITIEVAATNVLDKIDLDFKGSSKDQLERFYRQIKQEVAGILSSDDARHEAIKGEVEKKLKVLYKNDLKKVSKMEAEAAAEEQARADRLRRGNEAVDKLRSTSEAWIFWQTNIEPHVTNDAQVIRGLQERFNAHIRYEILPGYIRELLQNQVSYLEQKLQTIKQIQVLDDKKFVAGIVDQEISAISKGLKALEPMFVLSEADTCDISSQFKQKIQKSVDQAVNKRKYQLNKVETDLTSSTRQSRKLPQDACIAEGGTTFVQQQFDYGVKKSGFVRNNRVNYADNVSGVAALSLETPVQKAPGEQMLGRSYPSRPEQDPWENEPKQLWKPPVDTGRSDARPASRLHRSSGSVHSVAPRGNEDPRKTAMVDVNPTEKRFGLKSDIMLGQDFNAFSEEMRKNESDRKSSLANPAASNSVQILKKEKQWWKNERPAIDASRTRDNGSGDGHRSAKGEATGFGETIHAKTDNTDLKFSSGQRVWEQENGSSNYSVRQDTGKETLEDCKKENALLAAKIVTMEKAHQDLDRKYLSSFIEIRDLKEKCKQDEEIHEKLEEFRRELRFILMENRNYGRILQEVRHELLQIAIQRCLDQDLGQRGDSIYAKLHQQRQLVAAHTYTIATGKKFEPQMLVFNNLVSKALNDRHGHYRRIDEEYNSALEMLKSRLCNESKLSRVEARTLIARFPEWLNKGVLPFYVELSVDLSFQVKAEELLRTNRQEMPFREEESASQRYREFLSIYNELAANDSRLCRFSYNFCNDELQLMVFDYPEKYPVAVAAKLSRDFCQMIYKDCSRKIPGDPYSMWDQFYFAFLLTWAQKIENLWGLMMQKRRNQDSNYYVDLLNYVTFDMQSTSYESRKEDLLENLQDCNCSAQWKYRAFQDTIRKMKSRFAP